MTTDSPIGADLHLIISALQTDQVNPLDRADTPLSSATSLLPIAELAISDDPATALAYLDRYGDDPLQLDLAWSFLRRLLIKSARQEKDALVIQVAKGLIPLFLRHGSTADVDMLVRLALLSSMRAGDHAASGTLHLLLASMLITSGAHQTGIDHFRTGLTFTENISLNNDTPHWITPIVIFADLLDDPATADFFAKMQPKSAPDAAYAAFLQGWKARGQKRDDEAGGAYVTSLAFLAQSSPPSEYLRLLRLILQAELARVQNNPTLAEQAANAALALAQICCDPYSIATLALDQAIFGIDHAETIAITSIIDRLRVMVASVTAPHLQIMSQRLMHRQHSGFPAHNREKPTNPIPATNPMLTPREAALIELVALGLSNQEIARTLIIALPTVKKHLEHIFAKLGVRSRTAAIVALNAYQRAGEGAPPNGTR